MKLGGHAIDHGVQAVVLMRLALVTVVVTQAKATWLALRTQKQRFGELTSYENLHDPPGRLAQDLVDQREMPESSVCSVGDDSESVTADGEI